MLDLPDLLLGVSIPASETSSAQVPGFSHVLLSQRSRSSRRRNADDRRAGRRASARASERRRPVRRRSDRLSRAAPGSEEEYPDNEYQESSSLSNEQTIWVISAGVAAFLLFMGFLFMQGGPDHTQKKKRGSGGGHRLTRVERLRERVKNHPDNRSVRSQLVRILMINRKYQEAYSHLHELMKEDDIRAYTRGVECAFALRKKDDAERFFEKAKTFAPGQLEPIKKLFAAELRKVPGGEEMQAKSVSGVREAVENLKKGEACYKQGMGNNEKFRDAALLLRKALGVFEKAQQKYPYNHWIGRRIEHVNKYLFWANKMYTGNKSTMEE